MNSTHWTPFEKSVGFFVVCLFAVAGLTVFLDALPKDGATSVTFGALLSFGIGAVSGAFELVKYQPMSQENIFTMDLGLYYMAGNGFVAFFVYMVMCHAPELLPEKVQGRHLAQAFIAGTGSMALLRTKYLKFADGIDLVLESIRKKIQGAADTKNWDSIQSMLPGVKSPQELKIVLDNVVLQMKWLQMSPEQVQRVQEEIEKARKATEDETTCAYGVLRTLAEMRGVENVMAIAGNIRLLIEERRRQQPPPAAQPVFAMNQYLIPEVKNSGELTIVLDILAASVGGADPLPHDVAKPILDQIELSKSDAGPVDARIKTVIERYVQSAGIRKLNGLTHAIDEALKKSRHV